MWPILDFGVLVHIAQILGLFGAFLGRFSDISWSLLVVACQHGAGPLALPIRG